MMSKAELQVSDQSSKQPRSSSADIISLDDDSVDTLIGKLQYQVHMIAPGLPIKDVPKQKPGPGAITRPNPSAFRDDLDRWLREDFERVVKEYKKQQQDDKSSHTKDLYQLIVNILHRTYHDLGCICEVEKGEQIKSATPQASKQYEGDSASFEVQEQPNGIFRRTLGSIIDGKPRLADTEKGHLPVQTKAGTPSSNEKQSSSNDKRPAKRNYHWLFLSFWSVFLYPDNAAKSNDEMSKQTREVILCFDNASGSRMKQKMKAFLGEQHPRSLLPQVIEEIVHMYDDALWGFRTPVRDVEKLRGQHMPKRNDAEEKDESDRRRQNYFDMHELSRHLIHSQETLSAAETTLKAIIGSQEPLLVEKRAGEISRFSELFIKNLRFRAAAFVERLNNEISLALHINNLKQLDKVEELLTENKMDGKDVTKAVGYASVLFLPGTFISVNYVITFSLSLRRQRFAHESQGFFSMPFFDYDGSDWPNASKVWIWVAVAFPMTTTAFLWLYWTRTRTQNLARKKPKAEVPR
ncbi:hypothetical protein CCUS01_03406 [Colletotrichum cuscutae]|uniref:CorA-like Mg2+ transporter n=1 Tax=Colletotrichum cuscutae TaxID=1209917 RepID=A0AAI9Y8F2_9PEZI|nr:hypothetical protein CCUS01_03406 [Colletotrichum cuscutae]